MSSVGLNHRYMVRNFALPSAPWDPTQLPSLFAVYDASDTASITASGGFASQWNDKSGNAHHLAQSTGGNQPASGSRTQNSLNVMDFGTVLLDDYMTASWTAISQPYTTFSVVKWDSTSNTPYLYDSTDSAHRAALLTYSGGIEIFTNAAGFDSSTPSTSWRIITCRYNGASSVVRLNGAQVGSGNTASGTWGGITVGVDNALGGVNFLDGACGELIISNAACDDATCLTAETALNAKWAIF